MGKGDKKTKKGKRFMGSYGVIRKRKSNKPVYKPKRKPSARKKDAEVEEEVKTTAVKAKGKTEKAKGKTEKAKKPTAKKAASKKTASTKTTKKTSKKTSKKK